MSQSSLKPRLIHEDPNGLKTFAVDQPDGNAGGACHHYQTVAPDGTVVLEVKFQHGPVQEHGLNGVQHGSVLAIVADRLRCFQLGPFSSTLNELGLAGVGQAMNADAERTARRALAGVEGFNKKAPGVEK